MHRSSSNMNNNSNHSKNTHINRKQTANNLNMSCHQRILSNQERQHAVCNKYAVFNRQSSDRGLGMNTESKNKNNKAQPAGAKTPIPKTPLSVGGLFKRNRVTTIQKQESSPFPASLPFVGTESQAQPPTYLQAHLNVDDESVVSAPVVPSNSRAARRASRRRERGGGVEDQHQPHNSNNNSRSNSNSRPRRFGSIAKHFGKQILGQLEVLLHTNQADTKQSAASKAKKEPPQAIYDHPERPIADFSFYTKAQLVIENDNEFRLLQQALRERHAHNGTPLTTMGIRAYMLKDKLLDERAQRMRDFRQEEEHERQLEERRREILVQQQEQAQRIAAHQARLQAGHYNSRAGSMDHRGRNSRAGSMDHGAMLGSAPNSPRRAYISSGTSVGSNASANSTNQRNLLDGLRKTSMGLLREGVRTFDRLHTASHAESTSPLTPTRPTRRTVTAPAHPQRSPVSPLTPPRPARRTATAPAHQRQHPPQLTSHNSELSLDVEFGNSFNMNDEDGDSSTDVSLGGAQTRAYTAHPQAGPARGNVRPATGAYGNTRPVHTNTRPTQPAAHARSSSDLSYCDLDEMEVDFHTSMPTMEKMPTLKPMKLDRLDRQTSRELDVDFNRSMPLKLERHISEGDEYFHDRSGNAGSGGGGDFDVAAQRAAAAAVRTVSTAAPVFPVSSMASEIGAATAPLSPVSSVASGRLASAPMSPGSSMTSASTTGTPRSTGRRLLKSKRHPSQPSSPAPVNAPNQRARVVTNSRLSNNNRSSRSPPPPQFRFPRRAVTDPHAQIQAQTSRHSSASTAALLQDQMEVDFNTSLPLEWDQPMDQHAHARRSNHRNTYLIDPPSPDQQGSVFSAAASEASSIMSRRSHASSKRCSRSTTVQRAKAAIQGHGQSHSQGEIRIKAPPSFPSFRKSTSAQSRLAQHDPKPNSDVNHMLAMMAGTSNATAPRRSPSPSPPRGKLERYPSLTSLDASVGDGTSSFSAGVKV